jgi:hypothetical protein
VVLVFLRKLSCHDNLRCKRARVHVFVTDRESSPDHNSIRRPDAEPPRCKGLRLLCHYDYSRQPLSSMCTMFGARIDVIYLKPSKERAFHFEHEYEIATQHYDAGR